MDPSSRGDVSCVQLPFLIDPLLPNTAAAAAAAADVAVDAAAAAADRILHYVITSGPNTRGRRVGQS